MVVQLTYKLNKDTADGEFVEETTTDNPLTFLFGAGQMIPQFEANLEGKVVEDEFAFGIEAANAYGEVNPDAIVDLPMDAFKVEGKIQEDMLVVGNVLPMRDQEGRPMNGKVVAVRMDTVALDFNHPMAGTNLYFQGKIISAREATESELEHGHAHGPGGHQH